jgi:hypothetical protein
VPADPLYLNLGDFFGRKEFRYHLTPLPPSLTPITKDLLDFSQERPDGLIRTG